MEMNKVGMNTGLLDKNNNYIHVGDVVRLVLEDGDSRFFVVEFKTIERELNVTEGFDGDKQVFSITCVVFNWNGHDLLPCVHDGISDVSKMEVIKC